MPLSGAIAAVLLSAMGVALALFRSDPLEDILALERKGFATASRARYAKLLALLATELRAPESRGDVQSALAEWLRRALAPVLRGRSEEEASARADALADILARWEPLAEFFENAAGRVAGAGKLNLASLFKAKVCWRGKDILQSTLHRHQARERSAEEMGTEDRPYEPMDDAPARTLTARVVAKQVFRRFGDAPADRAVLVGLMEGRSVTEIAASAGWSRQQVYRFLARVRAWVEGGGVGPEGETP